MACEYLRKLVASLQGEAVALIFQAINASDKSFDYAALAEVGAQLAAANKALDACLLAPVTDRPAGAGCRCGPGLGRASGRGIGLGH